MLDTGDAFTNTGRYNTIDFTNGGDIRGLIRALDAYLKVAIEFAASSFISDALGGFSVQSAGKRRQMQ